MMTAESIDAGEGGQYARYLEGKTLAPPAGAYYLTPEGEPQQPPGRWLSQPSSLQALGIDPAAFQGKDFVALMEGKHPVTGRWIRPEGAGGGRGGGIDANFAAPKSVSIEWALCDREGRAEIEAAHSRAVEHAIAYMRERVPLVRRRSHGAVIEEPAADVLAAEYRHTTARGVDEGDLPDPHLHSHVVITSVIRGDGNVAAVSSRPVFRCAREVGAYYRSALATELSGLGFEIASRTGRHGRYFELARIDPALRETFSRRGREFARAAERFRAQHGRAPRRGEIRQLKRANRQGKRLIDRGDLDRAWRELADRHARERHAGQHADRDREREDARGIEEDRAAPVERSLEQLVERRLTEHAATFSPAELRATMLEQSAGELPPDQALSRAREMIASRAVLPLQGGRMTTLSLRAQEQQVARRLAELAQPAGRDVGERARIRAADRVAEQIGARLSSEQSNALAAITGPERAAILIGPAGAGKGVVIEAAARAEQLAGRATCGIAVAGSIAQRLGHDCPALAGHTLTLDGLLARTTSGRASLDARSTVYLDEAGVADTRRLSKLVDLVDRSGAKLVLIGDAAQLPSIGAGGMFEHLTRRLPHAELEEVMRTRDPAERQAWANLREGRPDKAMAHYLARGRLQILEDRDEAVERAARAWSALARTHDPSRLLLISDASNKEIDRLNARAQHLLRQHGKLGEQALPIPGVHYGISAGDRVAVIDQHRQAGQPRIENGSRGRVLDVTPDGGALIQFDVTGRTRHIASDELRIVRLAYAQHIHRAQGATVEHALIVTGGWQTSRETAYVQATRARGTTTWFVNRDELGQDGQDTDRIRRLSQLMRQSRGQTPSLAHRRQPAELEHPLYETLRPSRLTRFLHHLPGRARRPGIEALDHQRDREAARIER
jgi:conjugative relaxase-like TrwC/TraI family protein